MKKKIVIDPILKKEWGSEYDDIWKSKGAMFASLLETKPIIEEHKSRSMNDLTLEVGCGTARISSVLLKMGVRVLAIDISLKMLRTARWKTRKYKKNFDVILASADALPFKRDVFSTITCIRVLRYVSNYEKAIADMYRTVKPEGCLLLEITNLFGLASFCSRIRSLARRNVDYPYLRYKEIREILEKYNFTIVKVWPLLKIPHLIWLKSNTSLRIKVLLKIEKILQQITPLELLSRGILVKCTR